MTVKQLIEELSKLNPEAIVVKASDDEGNSYQEVTEVNTNNAISNPGEYYVEFGFLELNEQLIREGFTEEDLVEGPEAVVLY